MWSLPDIIRLNASAAANANKLRRAARSKRKPACEAYNCNRRADVVHMYYDIFSDDPKGNLALCERHDGCFSDFELFECDGCQRLMVDHYTWERYQTEYDGAVLCLKCAAEQLFADPKNWIEPEKVEQVVLEPYDPRRNGANVPLWSPKTGVLNVARCRHVLGVRQPIPAGIAFVGNAEFDSMDGHMISGQPLLDIIHGLNQPFAPVLDAAYQFAVSIGIYVRAEPVADLKEAA